MSADRSAVERIRQGLVEVELGDRLVEIKLRDGLGLGDIGFGGLVEEEVALRRSACRGDQRWAVGQVEVDETLAALEEALRHRTSDLVKVRLLPWPREVRKHPGFEALVRRLCLVPA